VTVKLAEEESPGSLAIAATTLLPTVEEGRSNLAVKAPPLETVTVDGLVVRVPFE